MINTEESCAVYSIYETLYHRNKTKFSSHQSDCLNVTLKSEEDSRQYQGISSTERSVAGGRREWTALRSFYSLECGEILVKICLLSSNISQ